MQFCKDCGGVLNLFGNNETEFCSSCLQQKIKHTPPPIQPTSAPACADPGQHILDDTILTCEKNKIVLRSKEGWELWSAPINTQTELKTVLSRAQRIYEIRSKRKKKT